MDWRGLACRKGGEGAFAIHLSNLAELELENRSPARVLGAAKLRLHGGTGTGKIFEIVKTCFRKNRSLTGTWLWKATN